MIKEISAEQFILWLMHSDGSIMYGHEDFITVKGKVKIDAHILKLPRLNLKNFIFQESVTIRNFFTKEVLIINSFFKKSLLFINIKFSDILLLSTTTIKLVCKKIFGCNTICTEQLALFGSFGCISRLCECNYRAITGCPWFPSEEMYFSA